MPLDDDAPQQVDDFLRAFATRIRWNPAASDRLAAAGEETLVILSQDEEPAESDAPRRLTVSARREGNNVDLEFVSALEGENVEDRLTYLSALPPCPTTARYPCASSATTHRRSVTRSTTASTS